MTGDRRRRVEAIFRGWTDGPRWVPPAVVFASLVAVAFVVEIGFLTDPPGAWLLSPVALGAYVLAAFLLGWPRVLWPALPALVLDVAMGYAFRLATGPTAPPLDPWLLAPRFATAVLLLGVFGVGGAAWLWDGVREGRIRVDPPAWGAALVAPPAALAAVALLAPVEWQFSPLDWGFRSGTPTAVTVVAVGLVTAVGLAWGLGRWHRAAGFTFVDRFLVAGIPVVVVQAVLAPLAPLAVQGFPVLERGVLSFESTYALQSGLRAAGEAYLAVALAALASLWLLPHRYGEPPSEEGG